MRRFLLSLSLFALPISAVGVWIAYLTDSPGPLPRGGGGMNFVRNSVQDFEGFTTGFSSTNGCAGIDPDQGKRCLQPLAE